MALFILTYIAGWIAIFFLAIFGLSLIFPTVLEKYFALLSQLGPKKEVRDFGIRYPVVFDNDFEVWSAFDSRYWPALYFIDRSGVIRGSHFGEFNYAESEQLIESL